jgi:hypothetical protein
MLYLSKKKNIYRFYKILVIEPTTEVKAESIGAPSVKEIGGQGGSGLKCLGLGTSSGDQSKVN